MAPASAGAIFCFLKLDALRRLGDGSQQLHQLALVHPAAVVGKGVEAALHAEREQDAPVQISREGRVGFLKALAQPLLDAVGEDALPTARKEDVYGPLVLHEGMEQLPASASLPDAVPRCRWCGVRWPG